MSKKHQRPLVLIVTQINPINVAYVYDEIIHAFGQNNEIFSPQIMALLGELALKENPEDLKHSYRVLNAAFVKNIRAAIKKMSPLKPWIFIGNCSKTTKLKFDHIIGFDGGSDFGNDKCFDYYIEADQQMIAEANMKIDYYTKDDVEHFFPTIAHLKLFLHTIGMEGDSVHESQPQPSTDEGNIQQ